MFTRLLALRILVSLTFLISIRTYLLDNSPVLLDSASSSDAVCCSSFATGAYGLSFEASTSLLVRSDKGTPQDHAGKQESDM